MRGEGTGLRGVDPDRFAGVRGLTAAEGDVEGRRRCTRSTSPGQMAAEDGRGAGWRRSATQVSSPGDGSDGNAAIRKGVAVRVIAPRHR